MLLTSWLKRLSSRSHSRRFRDGHLRSPGHQVSRPVDVARRLEQLEERALLSTITVTTLLDESDGGAGGTGLSLREAIALANADTASDTILLPGSSTFTLDGSILDTTTDLGRTIFPPITTPIVIEGGSSVLDAAGADARFFVVSGAGSLELNEIHLSGGVAKGGDGGAGGSGGGGGGAGLGGSVFVDGAGATLTINESAITGSSALGGNGGDPNFGENGDPAGVGGGGGGGLGGDGGRGGLSSTGAFGGGGGGSQTDAGNAPAAGTNNGGAGGQGRFQNGSPATGRGGGGGGGGGSNPNVQPTFGGSGADGGFGGGGGASGFRTFAGDGGFGGGGGGSAILNTGIGGANAQKGKGGAFAGDGGGAGDFSGDGGGGGGAGLGGAVFNLEGTVVLNNVLFAGNLAEGGNTNSNESQAGDGAGGALFNYDGNVTLTHVTMTENEVLAGVHNGAPAALALAGGIYNYNHPGGAAPSVTLFNTVVANSVGDEDIVNDAGGTVTAAGAVNTNLVETAVGALTGTVLTTDPGFAQRGQFSGKINVVPNSVSPVVNVGDGANSLATDLSGVPRPQRGSVDIGAYEFAFRDYGDANDQSAGGSVPGLAEAGSEFRVSEQGTDGDTTLDAVDPSVAFDSVNNRYLVVFQGESSNSEEEIFGQIINAADGTTVVDDFRITEQGGAGDTTLDSRTPDVAFNSTDQSYLAVWRTERLNSEDEIFAQIINAVDGSVIVDDFRISEEGVDGDTSTDARSPAVTYDSVNNQYLIIWTGTRSGDGEIYGQIIAGANGSVVLDDFQISQPIPGASYNFSFSPDVVFNSQASQYLTVWQSYLPSFDSEIFGQITSANGTVVVDDFRISETGTDTDFLSGRSPSVTYNSTSNQYLVVWTGNLPGFESEVFGQIINADGTVAQDDFRISRQGPDGDTSFFVNNASATYDPVSDEYYVFWDGRLDTGETEVFTQRLTPAGTPTGGNVQVSTQGPAGDDDFKATDPSAAINTNVGGAFLAWEGDLNAGEREIYGQRLELSTIPDYETRLIDDGPRHIIPDTPTVFLGVAAPDAEDDAIPTAAADGDDTTGQADDNDGVISVNGLAPGGTPTVDLLVTNNSGVPATLYGWIDYDDDGLFENATEQAMVSVPTGTTGGTVTLTFPTVPALTSTTKFARFRLSTDIAAANSTGQAADGEVEDYAFTISNNPPAAASFTRQTPATSPTDADTLVFLATFSEDVTGVDAADFVATGTTGSLTVNQLTAKTYEVTVSGGDLPGLNGFVGLDLNGSQNITNLGGTAVQSTEPAIDETYELKQVDFGDAPDNAAGTTTGNYNTLATDNGPSHTIVAGLFLGATADSDDGTLQNSAANADDQFVTGGANDEDGVLSPLDLLTTVGTAPNVTLLVTNTTGTTATLSGWVDYNQDGVFDNATERATATVATGTTDSRVTLTFPAVPTGAAGTTYARFRLSTDIAGQNSTGPASDGEVEDYVFAINAPADQPVTVASVLKIDSSTSGAPMLVDSDLFGESVTSLGDLNGDGVTDLAVGARGDDAGGADRGAVYVLLMNANGTVNSSVKIDSNTAGGPALANGDKFGDSITSLGDLDGDGVVDLAVGASGGASGGAVHLVFLNSNGTLKATARIDSTTPNGPAISSLDQFGTSVASVGDLNGDGVTDIAVGAIGDTFLTGAVHVLFLNSDGTVQSSTEISSGLNGGPTLPLVTSFGSAVASTGDLDGDGVADLAVGAQSDNTGGTARGAVYVLLMNPDGSVKSSTKIDDSTVGGPTLADTALFGLSIASTGDLDGDGVADLAVGATNDSTSGQPRGAIHVLLLNSNGTLKSSTTITDGISGGPALAAGDGFGIAVTSLGDVNGDGVVDLAVGANGDDTGGFNRGAVYVLHLSPVLPDLTAPTLTSITRNSPSTSPTNADTLVFDITFDENVANVSANDFTITGTTATGVLSGSGSTYTLTVSGGDLAGLNGTVGLDVTGGQNITDLAGNALPTAEPLTDEVYIVDNAAPVTTSFTRKTPVTSPTDANTLVFLATFSEDVTGVDAADFLVTGTTGTISVLQISASTYDVTISGGDLAGLNGTVGLDLAGGQNIADLAGNVLPNTEPVTDEVYVVDNTPPSTTSFTRKTPSASPTNADTLVFLATFNEDVTGVDAADFVVTGTTATVSISQVTASTYDVTVSGGDLAGLNGTVGLDLAATPSIVDSAGNALPNTEPTIDENYTIDNTAPATTSFTRQNPTVLTTDADSLVFRATFNEPVVIAGPSDFAVNGTTTAAVASVVSADAGAGLLWDVTLSGGDLSNFNGSVGLDLGGSQSISDLAGNALPGIEPATDESYTVSNPSSSITLVGGVLTIEDTNAVGLNNNYTLSLDQSVTPNVYVLTDPGNSFTTGIAGSTGSGTDAIRIPVTGITALRINGGNGDDTLIIDGSGGDPLFTRNVIYDGGNGIDGITANNLPGSFVTGVNANGGGKITVNGTRELRFRNLEPIDLSGSVVTTLEVQIDQDSTVTGPVTATLSNHANAGITRIDFDNGLESVFFPTPTESLIITGDLTDGDIINIEGVDASWNVPIIINAAGGADVVTFQTNPTVTGGGKLTVDAETVNILTGVVTDGGDLTINAEALASGTAGSINSGAGDLTLTADSFDLSPSSPLFGTGTLTIQPADPAATIGLGGGAGDLNLSDLELNTLAAGFGAIIIGDIANGTGTVNIDTAAFNDDVTIAGGTINDASGTDVTAPSVTFVGDVSPGQSPGILVVNGGFSLASGSTLNVELDGTTPGSTSTSHDQVDVTGTVTINNATLTGSLGFTPTVGDSFVIINNDGTDAVTGTFNGLAEGSTLNLGGQAFSISYAGGTGNDVVLTTVFLDFGDAPDTGSGTSTGNYETLLANGGPSHTIVTGLLLGTNIDGDDGTLQSGAANADDQFTAGGSDDEDGVVSVADLVGAEGVAPTITLEVTNSTGSTATLAGWIDYNQDGIFDDATERATATVATGTSGGQVTLTFPTIPSGSGGQTYARFRLSTDSAFVANPTSIGSADDGEVEDYAFSITAPAVTDSVGGDQGHDTRQPFATTTYVIAVNGDFPVRGDGSPNDSFTTGLGLPYLGEIIQFAGSFVPRGFLEANGQLLAISQHASLFGLLGTTYGGDGSSTFALPDLRGRTPIGVGTGTGLSTVALGQKSGVEFETVTEDQLPSHDHSVTGGTTDPTGGGQPVENRMPTLGLNPILDQNGEIRWVPFDFSPRGTAFAHGQLLQVSQHQNLFSFIGTTYGGDGITTFALPDLRGRVVMDDGAGPGLTSRARAATTGQETVTLTTANLPIHDHSLPSTGRTGSEGSGQSFSNMQPSIALNIQIAKTGLFPARNLVFDPAGVAAIDAQGQVLAPAVAETEFAGLIEEGIARWTAAGISAEQIATLQTAIITFGDLEPGILAAVDGPNTITLDRDAAGRAWFIDETPTDDDEFGGVDPLRGLVATTPGSQSGVDLLTVVMHEQGHLLGFDHDLSPGRLMSDALGIGVRRLPTGNEQASASGELESSNFLLQYDTGLAVISMFAGMPTLVPFPQPSPFIPTNGQLLSISTNQALFSLLGTTYGGDGNTTFSIPDFQGRVIVGRGQGSGLTNVVLGQEGGSETVTLSVAQMAGHSHVTAAAADTIPPSVTSFSRVTPATSPTNADTLVFRATFSEDVTGVSASDFAVTGTTGGISVSPVTASTYDITINGGDLATFDGVVELNLNSPVITDLAGNILPTNEPTIDEVYVVDNTAPVATSFSRKTPTVGATDADSLVFLATFSEDVTGVDATDFVATGTTGTVSVLQVTANTYDVTVTGGDLTGLNGTVGVDLATGQNITDLVENALPNVEPVTDEVYVVDNTAPVTTSFTRKTPAVGTTNADTLVFLATFNEAVTSVNTADFAVDGASTAAIISVVTADAGAGLLWDVTVSGGDLAGLNGTVGLNLAPGQNISDLAGNALPNAEPVTDESYLVDNTVPTTTSFARMTPLATPTNADTLVFDIVFNETVANVTANDFTISGTTATGTLAGSGSTYTLTVSGGDLAGLNGTVGLDLASGQDITDLAGNALPNVEPATDEVYVVDNAAPVTVSFTRQNPAVSTTDADSLVFRASFNESVVAVDTADFVINGTTTATVSTVVSADAGAGLLWDVTVSGGDLDKFNGAVGLDLSGSQNIADQAGNLLPGVEPATDESYTVENVSTDITLAGGVLTIADVAGVNNGYTLSLDQTVTPNVYVLSDPGNSFTTGIAGSTGSGTDAIRIPVTGITALRINGGNGDDTLIIDGSGGDPLFTRNVIYDGGNGIDGITANNLPGSFVTGVNANGGGKITVNGTRELRFRNLEPIDLSGSVVTTLEVQIDQDSTVTGPVTATLSNHANAGITRIDFDNGLESVYFPTPTESLIITGDLTDGDIINIEGVDASWNVPIIINAAGGADVVTFQTNPTVTGGGNLTVDAETVNILTAVGTDILTVNGGYNQAAGSTLNVELNGTTPVTGHDQVDVTGTITINNATLTGSLGFTPTVGDSFVIINNDGTDAVTGNFDGLPEGATLNLGGQDFSITYTGGTGNDVVLTAVSRDFGDAPDTGSGTGTGNYETLLANGGPSHSIVTGLLLGTNIDGDDGTLQNGAANADDQFASGGSDDEDGVLSPVDLAATEGAEPSITLQVTNNTGATATLAGWIDYNQDGVFDNATERATASVATGISNGQVTLTFPTIPSGSSGQTYARFRLSSDAAFVTDPASTGPVNSGEVEDYVFTIAAPSSGIVSSFLKITDGVNGGPALAGGDLFGFSTTSVGDLDGDGVNDLAVGAFRNDTGGTDRGSVDILFMNSDGTVKSSTKIASGVGGGPALANQDYFGSAVASLGDIDGDGVADLAVGAPADNTSGSRSGAVYVLLMNTDGTAKSSVKIANQLNGGPAIGASDFFGKALTGLGDLDGDGVFDLAVGARDDSTGGISRGAVHVLLLNADGTVKSASKIASNTGVSPTLVDGDKFGQSVASLGDLDGDGVTDLAVGAYGDDSGGTNRGAAYVLFMNSDGTARSVTKIASDTAGGPTLANSDLWGGSMTAVGDLDGDGVNDLAVGAYVSDTGGPDRGSVHILFLNSDGSAKGSTEIGSDTGGGPTLSDADRFGTSVASLGDLDGDGVNDLAVGAVYDDASGFNAGAVYMLFLAPLETDFGDAPDNGAGTRAGNYQTTDADGGPSHTIVTGLRLGANIDGDDGTLQNGVANADDQFTGGGSDDEDGVLSVLDLAGTVGAAPTVTLIATNTTGSAATLAGWIDYNQDGVFDNATERAQATVDSGTTNGQVTLTFPTIPNGSIGSTYARFRLSTDSAADDPTGFATDGEVEDYVFNMTAPTDASFVQTSTKIAHELNGGPTLSDADLFGSGVTSVGDLNGDGVIDLAVGAFVDDTGGLNRGALYVLMMNADGTVDSRVKIASGVNGGPTLGNGGAFGNDVASLGDIDGDGIDDLAVGAFRDSTGGGARGAVYVLHMNSNGSVKSSTKIASGMNGSPALGNYGYFGVGVASLGDVDGDGITDLAVGHYKDGTGGTRRGAVHVLRLNSDGSVKSSSKIASGTPGAPALANNTQFGASVAAIGDVDGDGVVDLAVGADRDDTGGLDRGAVHILRLNSDGTVKSSSKIASGTPGAPALANDDLFGASVTSMGDLDGDGVTDIAVGARKDKTGGTNRGAVHVLLLNPDGSVKEATKFASGINGTPSLENGNAFGASVLSIGDLNGDGTTDLIVGANGDGTGGPARGAIHLLNLPALPNGTTQVTLTAGVLTITDVDGRASNDNLSISHSGGIYTVTDNGGLAITTAIAGATGDGTSTVTFPDTGVTSIVFDTLAGDDAITVNSVQASLPGGFTVNDGTGINSFVLNGDIDTGAGNASVTVSQNIVLNPGSSITTSDGGITLNANPAGTTNAAFNGLTVNGATIASLGTGDILLNGTGGTSGVARGVEIFGASSVNSSGTGSVTILGQRGSSGFVNQFGFLIAGTSQITSAAGAIEITGIGGPVPGGNQGLGIVDTASVSATGNASITLNGTGGNAAGGFNHGVIMANDSSVNAVDGDIEITGVGLVGAAFGTRVTNVRSTGSGNITITGTNAGFRDVEPFGTSTLDIGPSGTLTINANTLQLPESTTTITGNGNLVIRPRTADTTIGIGGGAGTLNLTEAEVATIADGFSSITIGDVDNGTGAVDIRNAGFSDPLTIAGSPISVTGSLSLGSDLDLSGGTFNVDVNDASDFDALDVTGTIDISNATLNLNIAAFAAMDGDELVIIQNDSNDAVVGTFANFPNDLHVISTTFAGTTKTARISYLGGDGNDVSIILDDPAPTTSIASDPDGSNNLTIETVGDELLTFDDGVLISRRPLSTVDNLTLNAVPGNTDTLTLDLDQNAGLLGLSTITIDLGGDPNDDLVIVSNGIAASLNLTGAGAGSFVIGGLTIQFTGVGTNTINLTGIDDLELNFADDASNIDFRDIGGADGISEVSGTGFTTTTFTNPATRLTVNLGDSGSDVTIADLDAAFDPTSGIFINGGTGNDSFTLNDPVVGSRDDVTLDAVEVISVNVSAFEIVAPVTGSDGVDKQGTGTLILSGDSSFIGASSVTTGSLQVDGSTAAGTDFTVQSSASLTGDGSVGGAVSVVSGGTLSPGVDGTGILRTGSLTLASGAALPIQIAGDTPGSEHDQVLVTGSVDLGGATLTIDDSGFTADGSESLILIDNDGSDAVTGIFDGLPEGSLVTVGGSPLALTYVGGDGNDVQLVGNTVSISGPADEVREGDDAVFTISLLQPAAAPITVALSLNDGSATLASGDFAGLSAPGTLPTVSFATGEQTKTVNVSTLFDGITEPDETFELSLEGVFGTAALSTTENSASATIDGAELKLIDIPDQTIAADTGPIELIVTSASSEPNPAVLTTGPLPAFASFRDNGNGTGVFTFDPADTDEDSFETIFVRATDANGTTTDIFNLAVEAPVSTITTGPVHRLNAGGGAIDGFSGDQFANTGNQFTTRSAIDVSQVPGVPAALFQSTRWDASGGAELNYSLPVEAGDYEVRLYFAEIYGPTSRTGARLFDVSIEGQQVLDDFDVFTEAGGANRGIVRSFDVTSDRTIDIDFGHVVENPNIMGIEIIDTNVINNSGPRVDVISPVSVPVNGSQTINVSASDVDGDTITLTAIDLPDFATFTENGNGTGSVTLDPASTDDGAYPIAIQATSGTQPLSDVKSFVATVTRTEAVEQDQPVFGGSVINGGTVTATDGVRIDGPVDPVAEGTAAVFTVSLDAPAAGPVVVLLELNDGTATLAGDDFAPLTADGAPAAIVFEAGEQAKQVSIDITADNNGEIDETFSLSIINASGTSIDSANSTATATIAGAVIKIAPTADQTVAAGTGPVTIEVAATSTDGQPATLTADNLPAYATFTDNGNGTATITFDPSGEDIGSGTVNFTATDSNTSVSSSFNVEVVAAGTTQNNESIIRINAAGGAVGSFGGDQFANTGNRFSTRASIDLSDESIPEGTPEGIFQTTRWDARGGAALSYNIPVAAGDYQVRLYFAEIYGPTSRVGARVFNVDIEGQRVLTDFDVFSEAGAANKGIVRTFDVTSDGTINIEFGHVTENPNVMAIEIIDRNTIINTAPVVSPVAAQSVTPGESLTIPVTAADPDEADMITLAVQGLPDFASFTDNGDGTGEININPTSEDQGSFPVALQATSGDQSLTDTTAFELALNEIFDLI